jgi:hypothetical protein
MKNNDYILGYKINERLSYATLYHLYYILPHSMLLKHFIQYVL